MIKTTMKKSSARGLIADEKGALTIFMILVGTSVMILFLAVFNYGRFLMAGRQTELALEASLNSVLSYYEKSLAGEMGLFALDTEDALLEDIGKEYFIDNLGDPGKINGQACLSYNLSYPAESRMSVDSVIAAQAVDLERIEGLKSAFIDILKSAGVTDLKSVLSLVGKGAGGLAAGEDAGLTGDLDLDAADLDAARDAFNERVAEGEREWIDMLQAGGSGEDRRVKIWQLLSGEPPEGTHTIKYMPADIAYTGYISRFGFEGDAAFWEGLFLKPGSVLGGICFLPTAIFQIYDFIVEIKDGLSVAMDRNIKKALLVEYLINEMDFATNMPVMDRYFARAELEYILCGKDSSWDNIRFVALKLLMLRSFEHLINSIISGEVADEITLAAQVIESVIKGANDVEKLFNGERVPAFPGQSIINMSYKDHLRLLLYSQDEEILRGAARGLVQANIWHWEGTDGAGLLQGTDGAGLLAADFALDRFATEVRAEAMTRLSLWPFGGVTIRREGVMGYDKPFALLSQE